MAHVGQSRPDSGLGFQVKVLTPCSVVPLLSEAVGSHVLPERLERLRRGSEEV